jgi:hypothetical protein
LACTIAEAWIARRQRQDVGGDGLDHVVVARRHDDALEGVVDEDTLQGRQDDRIAAFDRVEVVERVPVGRAVTCDRRVAGLAGHGRADVVAGAFAQVGRVRALDDNLVDADHRDADVANGLALARGDRVRRGDRGARRKLVERSRLGQFVADLRAVGLVLELVAQRGLRV